MVALFLHHIVLIDPVGVSGRGLLLEHGGAVESTMLHVVLCICNNVVEHRVLCEVDRGDTVVEACGAVLPYLHGCKK